MNLRRRLFLAAAGAGLLPLPHSFSAEDSPKPRREPLKLGIVTYNIARAWDVPAIIKNCTEAKIEAVELRTTHAHGVEVTLSAEARKEVRKRFEGELSKRGLTSLMPETAYRDATYVFETAATK